MGCVGIGLLGVEIESFVHWKVEAFFLNGLEDFGSEVEVVNHAVVVWAEADEVFWGVVGFVCVYVMEVDYFVEVADGALFCDFSEGF